MKVQGEGQRSRRIRPIAFAGLALLLVCEHLSLGGAQGPADPLRVALAKRVDEAKEGTGAIVGLLTQRGRSFTSHGRARADGPELTAETIFEIGSITKVFTALLLADMVERACRLTFKDGFAKAGRRVIIVAGVPLGTPGATNMLRIAFVGSESAD